MVSTDNVKRESFEDPQRFYAFLQDNINNALVGVLTEQNKTTLLKDQVLETDWENKIAHKLGHKISNYYIVKQNVEATIHQKTDSTANLKLYLPLVSNMNCTISLLVW